MKVLRTVIVESRHRKVESGKWILLGCSSLAYILPDPYIPTIITLNLVNGEKAEAASFHGYTNAVAIV